MTDHAIPSAPTMGGAAREAARWGSGVTVFLILVYLAGVKPIGISADLLNYEILYDRAALTRVRDILFDPDAAFFLLAHLCARLGLNFEAFGFLVALLTMSVLTLTLRQLEVRKSVLIVLYLSYLFWLHPYTQIRTGLGLALLLFGIYSAHWSRWLAIGGGLMVHNSLVLPAAANLGLRLKPLVVAGFVGVIGLGLLLGYLQGPLDALRGRALAYEDLARSGVFAEINLLSLMPLAMIAYLMLASLYLPKLTRQEIFEGILSIVGIAAFYVFRSTPVLAFRIYEIFMIFFIILAARLWDRSPLFKIAIIPYVLLGLRSAFFSETSLVVW